MNKSSAEKIVRSGNVTWGQIQATLRRAYEAGACDERRAVVNKSFTKATSYNIMIGYAKEYDADRVVDGSRYGEWVGARHILIEFGRFWDGWKPERKTKTLPKPHHEPPIDLPF